jgi:hypothetical protein
MQVDITDAYREACTALGESIVRERLLQAEVQRLDHQAQQPAQPAPDAPA